MKSVLLKAHAKINLCLDITGTNKDNYHELDMVMIPLEFHDTILMSEIKKTNDNFITFDNLTIDKVEDSIVSRVVTKFLEKYNRPERFSISIHKAIPAKAGLGGGSSDTATVLNGLCNYLHINMSYKEKEEMLLSLGADCPYFINCVPARCKGVGEKISPIDVKKQYYVLIVQPSDGCKTKEVYGLFDKAPVKGGNVDKVCEALKNGDDELLKNSIFNVLEPAAMSMVSDIQKIKEKMNEFNLPVILMTGSGSAVFALSENKKDLKQAFKYFDRSTNTNVIFTKTLKR